MFILAQTSLFDNEEIEILGDLERLKLAIENMPDEEIVRRLRKIRKNGRNDWPVEAMWNTFIASYVFNHRSVNDLLRELSRNSQLRQICGLKPRFFKQADGRYKMYIVPSEAAYSRFLANLVKCEKEMEEAFDGLVDYMYEKLEGFGEDLAGDGKAIESYARTNGKKKSVKKGDRRRDEEANWGVKKYTESVNGKGEKVVKKTSWFGYRLHLIVDARYELPIAYKVTKASNSEKIEMLKIWKDLNCKRPRVVRRAKEFLADKGYDYTDLIKWLEKYEISPIIDIKNHWGKGDKTKQYRDTDLTYTYDGKVYWTDEKGKEIKLNYAGYDKQTESLRYKFPPQIEDKRIFRIKIEEDRRVFTPVARDSMKWKREYKKRTSVERENGRIDRDYGFERHTIRGQKKMTMYVTMGFLVQLSMAKGKIEQNIKERLSALVA